MVGEEQNKVEYPVKFPITQKERIFMSLQSYICLVIKQLQNELNHV